MNSLSCLSAFGLLQSVVTHLPLSAVHMVIRVMVGGGGASLEHRGEVGLHTHAARHARHDLTHLRTHMHSHAHTCSQRKSGSSQSRVVDSSCSVNGNKDKNQEGDEVYLPGFVTSPAGKRLNSSQT